MLPGGAISVVGVWTGIEARGQPTPWYVCSRWACCNDALDALVVGMIMCRAVIPREAARAAKQPLPCIQTSPCLRYAPRAFSSFWFIAAMESGAEQGNCKFLASWNSAAETGYSNFPPLS